MSRIGKTWLLTLLALALCAGARAQSNVLLVIGDDIGVDMIGAYGEGSAAPATPTIDSLASQGVLFRNTWAYPSCSPTRGAILTGRHPFRTGIGVWIRYPNNANPVVGTLRPSEWTIPELLDHAATGYTHAAIGKWHLHDVSFGSEVPRTIGGFGHYAGALTGELGDYSNWERVVDGVATTSTAYATTQTTDDALSWIQGQTGNWFCKVSYNAPHVPLHDPPAHLHSRNLTPQSGPREQYKAMIEAMDTEFGRLLAGIDPAVLADTHVIFFGDNGSVQTLAEPPFLPDRAKGTAYEGGVNVPLIYSGPATAQPGREVTELACAVDLFATVLELTGSTGALPPWVATDGVSLVPHLTNPTAPPVRTIAFTEQFFGDTWPSPNANGHATVRNDRYKLIHRYGEFHELYDLGADPFESTNLLGGTLTTTERQNYLTLLARVAELRTPRGRCLPFGVGCPGSAGVPAMTCVSPPRLGRTFELSLTGAEPGAWLALGLGASHVEFNTIPLPADLSQFGAGPGCLLFTSIDSLFGGIADGTGTATRQFAIPNTGNLMESTQFFQWFVFEIPTPPVNPAGMVTTGAMATVIGL